MLTVHLVQQVWTEIQQALKSVTTCRSLGRNPRDCLEGPNELPICKMWIWSSERTMLSFCFCSWFKHIETGFNLLLDPNIHLMGTKELAWHLVYQSPFQMQLWQPPLQLGYHESLSELDSAYSCPCLHGSMQHQYQSQQAQLLSTRMFSWSTFFSQVRISFSLSTLCT